jgi:BBSome-interacting protein 1
MSEEGKMSSLKEYIPHKGLLHHEDVPEYTLCKPKLMPLKSVTLEKLENMQKEAEKKLKNQQMNEQRS